MIGINSDNTFTLEKGTYEIHADMDVDGKYREVAFDTIRKAFIKANAFDPKGKIVGSYFWCRNLEKRINEDFKRRMKGG